MQRQLNTRVRLHGRPRGKPLVSTMAEDSFTTVGHGPGSEHRWVTQSGKVHPAHPYGPGMITTAK
jgi:hypothetical protein